MKNVQNLLVKSYIFIKRIFFFLEKLKNIKIYYKKKVFKKYLILFFFLKKKIHGFKKIIKFICFFFIIKKKFNFSKIQKLKLNFFIFFSKKKEISYFIIFLKV